MSNSSIPVDVNKFLKLLPRYQCHKQVNALQISGIFPNPRGVELHFVDDSVIPFQLTADWYNEHAPLVGGYLVAYDNGDLSFSPADVFHAGYSRMDEVDTDEDLLERCFWQFDAARNKSGAERYTFKGFMRAYAARVAGGVTKHTVGDVGVAHSNPAEAPVSIWDTLKDLGRPILCEIKLRDDPIAQSMNGKRVYLSCGDQFSWDSPFGLLTEYYLRPVDDATAEAFVSFGLVDRNEKPCIASGDVVVVTEDFTELVAPALPPKIICYTVQDLNRKSSVLTAMGNFDAGIPENLAMLYSECLAIAATENMEFLQVVYFLDVGIRALFRVKQIQDCAFSSLNA